MENTQTAKFRFIGYKVTETEIAIDPDMSKPGKLSVHFEADGQPFQDSKKYSLALTTEVKDDLGKVSIHVRVQAHFEYDNIDEAMLENMFATNAPVILFPYIRAYISSVTALSGIAPITLPTINFGKVVQMSKKN